MQFTPQQLTGGPKYQHHTRIGNWSEDIELEEIKLKDYLHKKEAGKLITTSKQAQLEESLEPRQLSDTSDGLLHAGNKVMLVSHQAKSFLAANPHDKVAKQFDAWVLTCGGHSAPCARNVFEIEPVDIGDDDVIHYGQNIRLKIEPFSKVHSPAYMHSEGVTALAAAKFSRHQEVTALAGATGETIWQILFPDTTSRLEMDGEPVPAGAPLVIRHNHTGSFLASDEIPYNNMFGCENEVHCFHYFSLNKTQNLTGEKKGDITGDDCLRKHGLPNIWTVVTATHGVGAAAEAAQ